MSIKWMAKRNGNGRLPEKAEPAELSGKAEKRDLAVHTIFTSGRYALVVKGIESCLLPPSSPSQQYLQWERSHTLPLLFGRRWVR